jgi:hypothetical protein
LECGDEGRREARGLVRDDTPWGTRPFQCREHHLDAVERPRRLQQAGFVVREERVAQFLEPGLARLDAERDADHAARAGAHHRAQRGERQRCQAVVDAQPVGGAGKVGRAVDQRAVEVEQHAANGRPHRGAAHAAGRRQATM